MGELNLIQMSPFCSYSPGWASEVQFLAYTLKASVQLNAGRESQNMMTLAVISCNLNRFHSLDINQYIQ